MRVVGEAKGGLALSRSVAEIDGGGGGVGLGLGVRRRRCYGGLLGFSYRERRCSQSGACGENATKKVSAIDGGHGKVYMLAVLGVSMMRLRRVEFVRN